MFRIFTLCPPYLLRVPQAVFRKKKWGGESFPQLRLPFLSEAPRPLGGLPLFQLLPCLSRQHPLTAVLRRLPEQTEPNCGRKVVTLTLVPWKWGRGEPAGSALGGRLGGTVSYQCDFSAPPLQVLHGVALLSPRKLINSNGTERLSVSCLPPTAVSSPLPPGQLGLSDQWLYMHVYKYSPPHASPF